MSWPSWTTTSVPNTSHNSTEFSPACTLTLMTSASVLRSCQLCPAPKCYYCCIPQVWIQLSVYSQLLIITCEMSALLFALLLISKGHYVGLGLSLSGVYNELF